MTYLHSAADYVTPTTEVSTQTTIFTFATQYIDTTVTTNVSTVIRTLNVTSSATLSPTLPNQYNIAPGPSTTLIPLNPSNHLLFGSTMYVRPLFVAVNESDPIPSTPPTEVYVFPSVNVINVPAVLDRDGHLRCATTSTYRTQCPNLETTIPSMENITQSTRQSISLPITGVNSNAESYFSRHHHPDYSAITSKFDMVQFSFSKPLVYAPLSDQFPSKIVNENFGYVPQTIIEWIAQQPDYVSKFPRIASCLPGGPSIKFLTREFCPRPALPARLPAWWPANHLRFADPGSDLTFSSTVTIPGRGCFHPGVCPTPAAPGATAAAATPVVTPEAHPQGGMFILSYL